MNQKCVLWVLLLVFLTVSAYGQVLEVDRFEGEDGIRGVVRAQDYLHVTVTAQLQDGQKIEAFQLTAEEKSNKYPFDACTLRGRGVYACNATIRVRGKSGLSQVAILLYDQGRPRRELKRVNAQLIVDGDGPLTKLTITPSSTRDGILSITVAADESVGGNSCNVAGIAMMDVYQGRDSSKKALLNPSINLPILPPEDTGKRACKDGGTFTAQVQGTGLQTICGQSRDRLGQAGPVSCQTIDVDMVAPSIQANSLRIERAGSLMQYINPQGVTADVSVIIKGTGPDGRHDIDLASIRGDFSKITSGTQGILSPSETFEKDDTVLAVWHGVTITPPITCSLEFYAEDRTKNATNGGNVLRSTQSCSLSIDDKPPVWKSISTGLSDRNGKTLFGKQGILKIEVEESDSGLNISDFRLDSPTDVTFKPQLCEKSGSIWRCMWEYANRNRLENYAFDLWVRATDKVGNPMVAKGVSAIGDSHDPELVLTIGQLPVQFVDSQGETVVDPVKGTKFSIIIPVRNAVSGKLNLSSVGGDIVEGTCSDESPDGIRNCSFDGEIVASGGYTGKLEFIFTDDAGNSFTVARPVNVSGIQSELNPDYWYQGDLSCSPSLIDRASAPYGPEKLVYCKGNLIPWNAQVRTGPVEIAALGMPDITGCFPSVEGFIQSIELLNREPRSRQPVFRITLAAVAFKVDDINFTCPLAIVSRVGKNITENPELQNVTFRLKFYNDDYGSVVEQIDKRIDDAIKRAQRGEKFLKNANKIVQLGEKACTIRTIIGQTVGTLNAVTAGLGITDAALQTQGCPLQGTFSSMCQNTGQIIEMWASIDKILAPICNSVNCQLGLWDALAAGTGNEGFKTVKEGINGDWAQDVPGFQWMRTVQKNQDVIGQKAGKAANGESTDSADISYAASPREFTPLHADVKESLPLSIANVCIPGIIRNMDKYRQIQCRYAVCLSDDVKTSGIPSHICRDEMSYQTCQFILQSVVLNSLPFVPLINYAKNFVQDMMSNPMAPIALVLGLGCDPFCDLIKAGGCWMESGYGIVCSVVKVANSVGQVMGQYQAVADTKGKFLQVDDGNCEKLSTIAKERDAKKSGKGSTPAADTSGGPAS